MDGDDSDRQVVLRHLVAVLAGDLVRVGGMLPSELPVPGPELDPGEAPQCAGAARLVSLGPFGMLAFEQARASPLLGDGRQGVHDRQRRLLHQPFPSQGAGQVLDQCLQIARGRSRAGEPVEDCLDGTGARSKLGVAQPVGELEGDSRMVESPVKRVAQASRQWIIDWSAGELVSLNASRRNSATLSTLSSARRTNACARQ